MLKRSKFYGTIESVAGILKVLLLIGTFTVMIIINTRGAFPYPDPF
jgi:amino acid permease